MRAEPNPWLARRVIAYAHQGGAHEWPSSTLLAIRRALQAGATAIELDVHATADGELVVCHDATVDRTTNGQGAIAEHTLAELQALDNAYWFVPGSDVAPGLPPESYPWRGRAPEDPELRIASLREVLETFPGVVLNLDIKQTGPAVAPYEETLARLLAEYERREDVIVASFLDLATQRFSAVAPRIGTSAGTLATAAFWRAVQDGAQPPPVQSVAFQVPERFGDAVVVDERFVGAAHRAGAAVHVWTVDDVEAIGRLVELGVDGVITNVPSALASLLASRGVAWVPGS